MTNHIHLIASTNKNPLSDIVRDLEEVTFESRKKWMLNAFTFRGTYSTNNYNFQFWERGYHPILLNNNLKIDQRLDYIHNNPVKQGLVLQPEHW